MPWYRELLNKALTLFDTVKKHCNLTFKIRSYLRLSTDQYDQLNLMEKIQDQQFLTSEYYSDWQPSLSGVCAKTTHKWSGGSPSVIRVHSSWKQTSLHSGFLYTQHPRSLTGAHLAKAGISSNQGRDLSPCRKTCLFPNANSVREAVLREQY